MTSKHGVGDRPGNDVLPEAACGERARNGAEAAAMAADQFGQIADACGQQRFDPLAQSARQDRRAAAGADRHHHLAAIDDGGKDERGKLGAVHDIDRNAMPASARSDLRVERIGRRNDRSNVAQISGKRIADADFKATRTGKRHDVFGDVGLAREPAHVSRGRAQQTQLAESRFAGADKHHHAGSGVEEEGEEAHRFAPMVGVH